MYVAIDDDPLICQVFEDILASEGLETKAFSSTTELVPLLQQNNIDGVIVDYHLGELNGVEALTALREQGLPKEIPALILSSDASDEVKRDCESHEMAFISKTDPEMFSQIYNKLAIPIR